MHNPLLQTKLYVPPMRAILVQRTRLVRKLDSGINNSQPGSGRKLSLISAPAGFGKTSLVTEWLSQQDWSVAWIALDEDDSEPQQFFNYLALSVQDIDGISQSLSGFLQSPQTIPTKSMMMAFINDVIGATSNFLLILDDYHLVKSAEIDLALAFLLDHMPPQLHLILTSRVDPALPLSRLRAQGQMTEIRADDLRFTVAETSAFLQNGMGITLTVEQIEALEERTEGWIAGLQMAALSMQNREDVTDFVSAFAGDDRYIADYLVDEVLAQQSAQTHDFLLQTSVLDRMTGPLCDALTGREDGREKLEELEQANLFVVPLDSWREWYRYHHLFADVLRHRLRRSGLEDVTNLHRRASEWYERQGDTGEAFRHALAAGNFEKAADIIEPVALQTLAESRPTRLLNWLAKLPQDVIAGRPWLCISGAWSKLLTGQVDDVEPLLQLTESDLSNTTQETMAGQEQFIGHMTALRAYIARWQNGDIPRSIALSQEAALHVHDENLFLRCAIYLNLGNANVVSGDLNAAAASYSEAQSAAEEVNMYYVALAAYSGLGEVEARQGALHRAEKIYQQALKLGIEWGRGSPLPATGYVHVCLGQVLYEWNDLDEALLHLTRGVELGEQSNDVSVVLFGMLILIALKQAQGELSAASEYLNRVRAILTKSTRAEVSSQISARQAQLWLAQDDMAAALNWAKEYAALTDGELQYARMPEYLAYARVCIEQSRRQSDGSYLTDAMNLLTRLLDKSERSGWIESMIEILALQSVALQAQGELEQANQTLSRALSMGEPDGYVRRFVDEGEPMAALLRPRKTDRYAAQLLAAFPDPIAIERSSAPSSPLVEPLSDRELEVLHLIADGLKYQEIADLLIVSLNTVRSHMKNIYGKLGVNNRTQAIAKARELDLH